MMKLAIYCLSILLSILFVFLAYKIGEKNSNKSDFTIDNLSKKGIYVTYKEACRAQDFEAARESMGSREEDKDFVFNAELLYLVSQNTEEASNRVLNLLAEDIIPPRPDSLVVFYGSSYYYPMIKYIEGISRHNNRCNNVLNLAISQGNESLARKVVELFKQNVDVDFEYTKSHYIRISDKGYNNTDKDAARKRLEEAIKEGAF